MLCIGIDHEGTEKKYATIQTGGQWPQGGLQMAIPV